MRLKHKLTASAANGFTLLEVLVWMAIVGIAISFVTLAVGTGSRADELKGDVEKLTGMMQLAVEESVLTSKPIGLRFSETFGKRDLETRYEWSVFEQGKWLPLLEHSFFKEQKFSAGSELQLRFEGRAAELAGPARSKKKSDDDKDDDKEEDDKESQYKPDVFFLHSGEITPAFEIEVRAESISDEYLIEGNPMGQIRLRRRNDAQAEWL